MKPPAAAATDAGEERDVIAFVADDSNGQLRAPNEGRKEGRDGAREGGGRQEKEAIPVVGGDGDGAERVYVQISLQPEG